MTFRQSQGGDVSVARMVRKQLYVDEGQDAFLRCEAARLGVTQADVVRTAIDSLRSGAQLDTRDASWDELRGLWAKAAASAGAPYRFQRSDAYEDERGSAQ